MVDSKKASRPRNKAGYRHTNRKGETFNNNNDEMKQ